MAGAQLASSSFPSLESGTLVHGMVLPTFEVGVITLDKPLWKHPPRYAQACVS